MVTCQECGKPLGTTGWVKVLKPTNKPYKEQLTSIGENILNVNRRIRDPIPPGYTRKTFCISCYDAKEDRRTIGIPWMRKKYYPEKDTSTKSRVLRFK